MKWDPLSELSDVVVQLFFAAVCAYAGLKLFGEYRKAFYNDPKAIMTIEVILNLIRSGSAPGYLAAISVVAAAVFLWNALQDLSSLVYVAAHRFLP